MFDGLMGGAVFSDAEAVVAPYIFHGQLHQGGHTHGWFHVVAENEERAAGGDYASVCHDAVHDGGHGQLADSGVEECSREIAVGKRVGVAEESVGLVAVGEIGRGHDHIVDLGREFGEHVARCLACRYVVFMRNGLVVDFRQLVGEHVAQFAVEFGVCGGPCLTPGAALADYGTQCVGTLGIKFFDVVEDNERIVGVAAEIGDGGAVVGA